MIGPVIGMAVCLVIILISTDTWMGEMIGAAMEDDEPHPLAFAGLFATGAAIMIYLWLGSILLSR